jgi:hypothetical protein
MKYDLELVRYCHFFSNVGNVEVMQTALITVAMNETASWEQIGHDNIHTWTSGLLWAAI